MTDHSRLMWRCRRGIRELDLLLETFLEEYYPELSDQDKKLFESLLAESDPDLRSWVLGRRQPDNPVYHPLVAKLKSLNKEKNAG